MPQVLDDAQQEHVGAVSPLLPLALLEALRRRDLPAEILEDENFSESLPRRLGLSDVVFIQIRRYEDALRRGHDVSVSEAMNLMRLILRRPDAAAVLREAGGEIARRYFRRFKRPAATRVAGRGLPRPLLFIAIRRTSRRLLNRLLGRGRLELVGRPLVARISHPFTADAGGAGTACLLFSGALEELILLYTGAASAVQHPHCEARGDDVCEWRLAT
ncbi:MAG: hypothetical protein ACRELD_02535 [Longimicrobiales bacterium]